MNQVQLCLVTFLLAIVVYMCTFLYMDSLSSTWKQGIYYQRSKTKQMVEQSMRMSDEHKRQCDALRHRY